MEVLLVNIPTFKYRLFGEHIGLGSLAANLRKQGIETAIYDPCFENASLEDIAERIVKCNPPVLGLSIVSHLTINNCITLCELLASHKFPGYIVLGGHPATFLSRELLEKAENVTAVIKGDADVTFPLLANYFLKRNGSPLSKIQNLLLRHDGNIIETATSHVLPDLDTLPFPSRDSLEAYPELVKPVQILSSRGCNFGCSYCDIQSYYDYTNSGNKWIARSPANVVDEIQMITERYRKTVFSFNDANFLGAGELGVQRAHGIADEIVRRRLHVKFAITARAQGIERELFIHLKDAGLHAVILGLESGVDAVLRRYNKGTTVDQNIRAVSIIRDLELYASYGFIYYDYATKLEDLVENAEFLKKIGYSSFKSLECLRIYAGTKEEARVKEKGLLMRDGFNSNYKLLDPNIVAFSKIAEALKSKYSLEDNIVALRGKLIRFAKTHKEKDIVRNLSTEIKLLKRDCEAFFVNILDFSIKEIRKSPIEAVSIVMVEAERHHAELKRRIADVEESLKDAESCSR